MKDIKLHHKSGPFGDETSLYALEWEEGATVQDLIDFALSKKDEWGYIDIKVDVGSINIYRRLEYRYGEILDDKIPSRVKSSTIVQGSANGGWTRMDYSVKV